MALWKTSILVARACNRCITVRFFDSIDPIFATFIYSLLIPGPGAGVAFKMTAVRDKTPNLREVALFLPNEKEDWEWYCDIACREARNLLADGKVDVLKLFCRGNVVKDDWGPFEWEEEVLLKLVEDYKSEGLGLPSLISNEEADKGYRMKMSRLEGLEAMRCLLGADRQVSCVLT